MALDTAETVQKICFLSIDLTNKQLWNVYNQHRKQRILRLGLIAKNERIFARYVRKEIQGLT